MAQPYQIFSGNSVSGGAAIPTPGGEYIVISNQEAQNYSGNGGTRGTLTAGASGYTNSEGSSLSGTAGSTAQGTNPYKNGTVPDYNSGLTTIVQDSTKGIFVRFTNPVGRGN